jgi:hypothetical protein
VEQTFRTSKHLLATRPIFLVGGFGGAEMLGIGRDDGERLGRGAKQDRVDDRLVLERDLGH